jgi:hypothetical protein
MIQSSEYTPVSAMDFLERFFGFGHHLDQGSGSLEAIVLIALLIVIFGLGLGYFHKHRPHK